MPAPGDGGGWPATCRRAARIRHRRVEARIVEPPIGVGTAKRLVLLREVPWRLARGIARRRIGPGVQ